MRLSSRLTHKEGFTLIELLVVIAIILLLVSVALPNYLDALLRTRVVRAKTDIRTLLLAADAYYSDWYNYPADHHASWRHGSDSITGFVTLTSPSQYLVQIPMDPFGKKDLPTTVTTIEQVKDYAIHTSYHYLGASGSDTGLCGGGERLKKLCRGHPCGCGDVFEYQFPSFPAYKYPLKNRGCVHSFAVVSISPRGEWNYTPNNSNPFVTPNTEWNSFPISTCVRMGLEVTSYTPTNGARSKGQIFGMTGNWRQGYFRLDTEIVGRL